MDVLNTTTMLLWSIRCTNCGIFPETPRTFCVNAWQYKSIICRYESEHFFHAKHQQFLSLSLVCRKILHNAFPPVLRDELQTWMNWRYCTRDPREVLDNKRKDKNNSIPTRAASHTPKRSDIVFMCRMSVVVVQCEGRYLSRCHLSVSNQQQCSFLP